MTQRVELIDLPDNFLTMPTGEAAIAAGVAYKLQRTRAEQCNGRLFEIANLYEETP